MLGINAVYPYNLACTYLDFLAKETESKTLALALFHAIKQITVIWNWCAAYMEHTDCQNLKT